MIKNARELVLTALVRMEKDEGYSNIVLNSLLEKAELSQNDKAFATRLFYGVIEKKLLLDYNISLLLKKKNQKIDPDIREILRMGMYQLLFMENIPDNAVVNECVKLCAFTRKISAKGFVNALLRNKIREGKQILLPEKKNKDYYSVLFSADDSVISLFKEQYGIEKTESIFSSFADETKLFIKVNTRKISSENLIKKLNSKNIEAEEIFENCLEIKNGGNLTKTEEFKNGEFFVQDMASQLCVKALECENAERILDVCGAPGGKSFNAAITAGEKTEVICCDLSENRVSLIENGKQRLGLSNVKGMVQDATVFNEKLGAFDRILCDVVCSGLGVIAKKPEIKYKKINPDTLWEIQNKILENSSRYLRENGILVYSTCTLNKRENQDVIENFLKNHPEFEPHPLCISENGEYAKTLFPDIDGCDGFFISAVKKKGH